MRARRARTVAELRSRLAALHSDESLAAAAAFRPRPTDLFIATYPKSGTTWLQQIVHHLRGGQMDFDEICQVVPWLEAALDTGVHPDGEQPGQLRAFKSHCSAAACPPGVRAVVAVRDPADVLVSFFHFLEGWMFEAGAIDLSTFATEFFAAGSNSGRYWEHLVGWYGRRHEPEVLMLCFEHMIEDLPAVIERIAGHAGLEPDPDHLATVAHRASFEVMRENARRFDDHLLREARNAACGLPPGGASGKVRRGKSGAGAGLAPEIRELLAREWAAVVEPATGCADYPALRRALGRELFG